MLPSVSSRRRPWRAGEPAEAGRSEQEPSLRAPCRTPCGPVACHWKTMPRTAPRDGEPIGDSACTVVDPTCRKTNRQRQGPDFCYRLHRFFNPSDFQDRFQRRDHPTMIYLAPRGRSSKPAELTPGRYHPAHSHFVINRGEPAALDQNPKNDPVAVLPSRQRSPRWHPQSTDRRQCQPLKRWQCRRQGKPRWPQPHHRQPRNCHRSATAVSLLAIPLAAV